MRRTKGHLSSAAWRRVRWWGLGLLLLLAACTSAPAPPSVTPAAGGPTQAATITAYHGQTSMVFAVAWSPDGTRIASATGNTSVEHPRETLQVWNATAGQLYISYPIPSSTIYADGTFSVAWSPDGTRTASGGADTIVHLWTAPALCRT